MIAPPPDNVVPADPQGQVPNPFVFALSQVNATQFSAGHAKIVDSTTFKVSTEIAVADVHVEQGAMRELHVNFNIFLLSIAYLSITV
jgi:oxalate decarboxylase/phosphoglucose isomerase-like protein (cupin superfamily)